MNMLRALFVSEGMQSHGIGKALLNYAKDKRSKLLLNVYPKKYTSNIFLSKRGI